MARFLKDFPGILAFFGENGVTALGGFQSIKQWLTSRAQRKKQSGSVTSEKSSP
jgi:hypothetical protein